MKKITSVLAGILIFGSASAHASDDLDLARYAQSSAALSAISSAVSSIGGCSVPLVFDETKTDNESILGVHCRGTDDDEASVFIRFMDDGYSLIPKGFEYAG